MKELSRFEMATVKRIAKSTKTLRTKRDKLMAVIAKSQEELDAINVAIDRFEAPVKDMTGGFTSEEVLNGVMEVVEATEDTPTGEVDDTEATTDVEVSAEDAVEIDPNVQSPLESEVTE